MRLGIRLFGQQILIQVSESNVQVLTEGNIAQFGIDIPRRTKEIYSAPAKQTKFTRTYPSVR